MIEQRKAISIHAPRTGSDKGRYKKTKPQTISIHAPRTGSDEASLMLANSFDKFQSTLPARGAT